MNDRADAANPSRDVAYTFDEFRLEPARRRLVRHGESVPMAPRVLDTLMELVRRPRVVISKDALMRAIWGNAIVEENNLNQNISALRRALQDQRGTNRYIVTHPGRGYAFVGEVEVVTLAPAAGEVTTTLAVLPFDNLSGDPQREYFVDGLTEETISALGQVDPGRLTVLSRSAVMPYKHAGADFARIGREIGATYVVEGSLRSEGATLRTTARLIRTRDRKQVWSASFDGEPASVLEFQRELAQAIANQIRSTLEPSKLDAIGRRQPQNAEAFDFYLRGRHAWHGLTAATTRRALEMYHRATELDPDYALAWSGMVDAYATAPISGDAEPAAVRSPARAAMEQALRAQPALAETQTSVAFFKYFLEWDWPAAEAALLLAIDRDPTYSSAYRLLGQLYCMTRRFEEAEGAMRRARELDPFLPHHHALSAQVAFSAGDYDACARFARQALALDPDFWIGHLHYMQACEQLGDAAVLERAIQDARRARHASSKIVAMRAYGLARLGRADEARKLLDMLISLSRERYVPPWPIATIYLGLGEPDAALQWLERGYAARDVHLILLRVDAKWSQALRDDPRFEALLDRCAFSVHQRGGSGRALR